MEFVAPLVRMFHVFMEIVHFVVTVAELAIFLIIVFGGVIRLPGSELTLQEGLEATFNVIEKRKEATKVGDIMNNGYAKLNREMDGLLATNATLANTLENTFKCPRFDEDLPK